MIGDIRCGAFEQYGTDYDRRIWWCTRSETITSHLYQIEYGIYQGYKVRVLTPFRGLGKGILEMLAEYNWSDYLVSNLSQ